MPRYWKRADRDDFDGPDEVSDAEAEVLDAQDDWKARHARRGARLEAMVERLDAAWGLTDEGSQAQREARERCRRLDALLEAHDNQECPIADYEFPEPDPDRDRGERWDY